MREWSKKNREKINSWAKRYRNDQNNRSKINKLKRKWVASNKDREKEIHKKSYYSDEYRYERHSYQCIIQRCLNIKNTNYKYYGAKGIKICDKWIESFQNFLEDVGQRPEPKILYSLDRIDNTKDYCKENCQWITKSENSKKSWIDKDDLYRSKI